MVAADNPDRGQSLVPVTTNPGADHSPAWSPNGKWIACVSQLDAQVLDYATHNLTVAPARGGGQNVLTQKLDLRVKRPRFSADVQSLYFT